MSASDEATAVPTGAQSAEPTTSTSGPSRRAVKRTVLLVVMLFVLYYLVLPQLARGRESADLIADLNPVLLVVALGLQIASLLAYAVMTRVTLPAEPHLSMFTLMRVQMATKAVTNVVPGGSAAGGTLGYRLFTEAGVPATAAGFSLATVGLGSAVVLNVLLWVTLLVSIPFKGVQPGYVVAAITGVVLLAAAAALVWLLMEGRGWAERLLRRLVRPIPWVHEDSAARFVRQLADRLHDLAGQPELIRRGVLWAAAHWLLNAASLWVIIRAFGPSVNPIDLVVAFGVVQVIAAVPITPGGLGLVEAALPGLLAGLGGVPVATGLVAVLTWRFIQFWLPIPLGALSYTSLKFGAHGRPRRIDVRRDLSDDIDTDGTRRVSDDTVGPGR